ncbi:MAG: hypothetical protein ACE5EL_08975, partial [Anaerolineae bacterium]
MVVRQRARAPSLVIVAMAVAAGVAVAPGAGPQQGQGVAAQAEDVGAAGDGDLLAQVGGLPARVRVQGGRAFVAQGPRVVIVDMTDPDAPVVAGRTDLLSADVKDLAVESAGATGARVWALGAPRAADETVLVALDVGAGAAVTILSETPLEGSYDRVAVGGGRVWLGGADVLEIDAADPALPTVAGRLAMAGDMAVAQLEVVGDRLVVLARGNTRQGVPPSLQLYDIAPGTVPAAAGSLQLPEGSYWQLSMAPSAPYVWLVDDSSLVAVDVLGPAGPQVAARNDLEPRTYSSTIAAAGGHVYLATDYGFCPGSGMVVVDVEGDAVRGVREVRAGVDTAVAAGASGDVALVASVDGNLTVLRAGVDPPEWAGRVTGVGFARSVGAADGAAYVALRNGMAIVDTAEAARARVVGHTARFRYVAGFAVGRGIVFVADSGRCDVLGAGLAAVDVGDPASPVELWRKGLRGVWLWISLDGDRLAV